MNYEEYKNLKPHISTKKLSKIKIPKRDPKVFRELIEIIKENERIREEWELKHGPCNECNI